jgi:hypothetical protein
MEFFVHFAVAQQDCSTESILFPIVRVCGGPISTATLVQRRRCFPLGEGCEFLCIKLISPPVRSSLTSLDRPHQEFLNINSSQQLPSLITPTITSQNHPRWSRFRFQLSKSSFSSPSFQRSFDPSSGTSQHENPVSSKYANDKIPPT